MIPNENRPVTCRYWKVFITEKSDFGYSLTVENEIRKLDKHDNGG